MGTELTITAANRFYVQICIGCHVNTAQQTKLSNPIRNNNGKFLNEELQPPVTSLMLVHDTETRGRVVRTIHCNWSHLLSHDQGQLNFPNMSSS